MKDKIVCPKSSTGKLEDIYPRKISGTFICKECNLTSLQGVPTKINYGSFDAAKNLLTDFEFIPEYVGDMAILFDNRLTSLAGIHKQLKHCKMFYCSFNPIKTGGIGLLLIDGLKYINGERGLTIINNYVGKPKSEIFKCQKELIDNGFEEFAKL